MTINISGILKSPQGYPVQDAEIIFEQTRTSTEVLAGTRFSINTDQQGNYSTTIGIGVFSFKVRFQGEVQYRTVASNILVTQAMDNYTLNRIIEDQSQIQDVDYDLLQDVLQARDQTLAAAQEAQTSQSTAGTKALEASSSAQQALESKTQAQNSEASALASKIQAQDSEQTAQSSQAQANISQGLAQSKASEASNSASDALSDKNAAQQQADSALSSKTQAESFQQQADNGQQQQLQSQGLASSKAQEAQDSQVSQQSDQLIATTKATQASTSQAQAQTSQNTSIAKAEEASTSQAAAQGSQLLATTKAQESSQSQVLAQKWAANPENTEVSGGLYSALHYAAKAAQAAQTATGQLVWRGGWSAQSGATPPTPSGTTQDFYRITQAGTILGVLYEVGDYIHWDNINSVWFKMDGTDSVVSINGRTGQVTLDQDQVGALPVQGIAIQAHKLATARNISIIGDGTGYASFDGTNDQQLSLSLKASGVTPGVLTKVTVNQKGIITQGEQLQAQDIPNLDWSKITTGKPTTLQGYGITDAVSSTGVASASNKLAVPRQINGTNFDGTQGITTETWGTTRQITIGNTQKNVNGGQPISWTLQEIGAAPTGYGLGVGGTQITSIVGDVPLRRHSGFFQGSNIEGLSSGGHQWKYVFNQAHENASGYFGYLAIDFFGEHAWIGAQVNGGNTGPFELYHTGFKPTPAELGASVYRALAPDTNLNSVYGSAWAGFINVPGNTPNWPFGASGGSMMVSAHDQFTRQIAFAATAGTIMHRRQTESIGSWTEWSPIYSSEHKPTASEIGAFPSGYIGPGANIDLHYGPSNTGSYSVVGANTTGWPWNNTSAGTLLVEDIDGFTRQTAARADSPDTMIRHRGPIQGVWSAWMRVYNEGSKPTPQEIGSISYGKNTLNNASFGPGFITSQDSGPAWVASYFGTDTGEKVVMGTLNGVPVIGAHGPNLDAWASLFINCSAAVSPDRSTVINDPFARNQGDLQNYKVYHEGHKPTVDEVTGLRAEINELKSWPKMSNPTVAGQWDTWVVEHRNGLIEQGGVISIDNAATGHLFNFLVPFSRAFTVTLTPLFDGGRGGGAEANNGIITFTNNSFTAVSGQAKSPCRFMWTAKGIKQ